VLTCARCLWFEGWVWWIRRRHCSAVSSVIRLAVGDGCGSAQLGAGLSSAGVRSVAPLLAWPAPTRACGAFDCLSAGRVGAIAAPAVGRAPPRGALAAPFGLRPWPPPWARSPPVCPGSRVLVRASCQTCCLQSPGSPALHARFLFRARRHPVGPSLATVTSRPLATVPCPARSVAASARVLSGRCASWPQLPRATYVAPGLLSFRLSSGLCAGPGPGV